MNRPVSLRCLKTLPFLLIRGATPHYPLCSIICSSIQSANLCLLMHNYHSSQLENQFEQMTLYKNGIWPDIIHNVDTKTLQFHRFKNQIRYPELKPIFIRLEETSFSKDKAVPLRTRSHLSSPSHPQFLVSAVSCGVTLESRLHMEGQRNFDLHRPYADCVILPVESGLRAQCPVLPEGHREALNVLQRRLSGACAVTVLFFFSWPGRHG